MHNLLYTGQGFSLFEFFLPRAQVKVNVSSLPQRAHRNREKCNPLKRSGKNKWPPIPGKAWDNSFFLRGLGMLQEAARLIITKMKLKCPYFCLSDPQMHLFAHAAFPPCFSEK